MSAGSLKEALRLQREAAELGFDWRQIDELWDKLREEIVELQAAVGEGPARIEDELGDVMFMLVNLARHLGVDADAALRSTNAKFQRRFSHVCRDLERLPPIGDPRRIDEMEARWQDAKRAE